MSAHVLVSSQNPLNKPCEVTVTAQHQEGLQRFQMWHCKDNGHNYIFLQKHFLVNFHVEAIDAVEVKTKVL